MNRHMKYLLVSAAAVAGWHSASLAASATSNANAEIVAAIAIANTADLDFAAIVAAAGADTVVVSAAGARTCGGTLTCTGAVAAASFDVTGGANLGYSITLPASATISSGGNNMTVNAFTDSLGGTGTLSGAGTQTFTVGATLNVGASQPAGSYTGTFNVTVDYN